MIMALTEEKIKKVIVKCQNLLSHPQTTFWINKIDRADVLNCPNSSAKSSTAKIITTTTNKMIKPDLFILGTDCIKPSVKTATSFVGGTFKVNNGKSLRQKEPYLVTETDASKLSWTVLQWRVNWGKMVRKEEVSAHKFSGINSSNVCNSNIHKKTTKYSN